ncbi:MAG: MATE family efflux transporter, partial [Burkholderiales bacterium]|nr:MATE family efflux transporter [Burkholderiales bacterium]
QLAVMAYAVIDTVMAGRYGTDDLAAVGIGASIYFSVFVALMGVLLAVTPIAAQLLGAGRAAAIGETIRQAGWLAVALSALSIAIFSWPEPFLALSEPPPAVEAKVRAYLAIAAWGAPAALGFRLFASYTTAVSLPRAMMVLNFVGLAVKVPLNVVFVFGELGAPAMGAAGCALATTIANWLVCILAWAWCWRAPGYRRYAVFARGSPPRWRDQRELLALGVPIGVTILVDVTAFTFMALFVARLGAINSAAHQIAANVAALMYMLPLSLGTAVSVLVGQAIGARAFVLARKTGAIGIGLALVLAIVAGTALALGANGVASLYSSDVAVDALAATLLTIVGVYHCFDAVLVAAVSALRGYKRTVVPLLCNAVGLWGVGLAGGYALGLTDAIDLRWLGRATPLGTPGFWVAAVAGTCVAALGIVSYFFAISAAERSRHAKAA